MTDQGKRCGTCRWYTPDIGRFGGIGSCEFPLPPLPDSMPCTGQEMMLMSPNCGTTCPCWEAKDV